MQVKINCIKSKKNETKFFPGNTAVRHTLILHMETHQLQITPLLPIPKILIYLIQQYYVNYHMPFIYDKYHIFTINLSDFNYHKYHIFNANTLVRLAIAYTVHDDLVLHHLGYILNTKKT